MKKTEGILLTIIKILLLMALATPIISSHSFVFPYYTPANFSFQLIIEVSAIIFAVLLIINPSFYPKPTVLTLSLTGFFIIQALLLFASVEPQRSFLGSPERIAGVWNLFHYYLFYVIATSISKTDSKLTRHLTFGSVIIAIIVSIKYFVLEAGSQLPYAQYSFGNPGFIANYAALHIPLVIWIILNSKIREEKIALSGIIALFSAVVITAQNRGTIIALTIGLLLLSSYFLMQIKRGVLIAALFIALFVGSYSLLIANKDASFIQNNYLLTKLTHWSLSEGTVRNRLILWNEAFRGFLDKPLFGWGRENFQNVFEKYYDPTLYITSPSEPWIDRAHNIVMDELVAGGLVGVLAYLAVLIIFIVTLIKKVFQQAKNRHFVLIFMVFFLIYGIQLLFTLDTLATYLPLFLVFTIIAINSYTEKYDLQKHTIHQKAIRISSVLVAVGLIFGSFMFTAIPTLANYRFSKLFYIIPYNLNAFEEEHKKLDSIIPDSNTYKADLLMIEAFHLQKFAGANKTDQRITDFEQALIPKLESAILEHPNSYLKLKVYKYVLLSDLSRRIDNKEMRDENVAFWESLIKSYPNRQLFLLNTAEANGIAGNLDREVELLKETIALTPSAPKIPSLYWTLGNVYRLSYKDKEAVGAYVESVSRKFLPDELIDIIGVANYLSQFPDGLASARDIYIKMLAIQPNSAAFHANLAYIYGKLGEKKLALEEANRAAELDSSHKADIENFIKNL